MQKCKPKIRGHQISISEKMLSYVDSSFSPDVVWALVPAVASTLKNAILTFKPVKKPWPTHKQSTLTNMTRLPFLIFELTNKIYCSFDIPAMIDLKGKTTKLKYI